MRSYRGFSLDTSPFALWLFLHVVSMTYPMLRLVASRSVPLHLLVSQAPQWDDQYAILAAIGIRPDADQYREERWRFHALRVDLRG